MRRAFLIGVLGAIGFVGFVAINLWQGWSAVERIPVDTERARSQLAYAGGALPDAETAVLVVGVDRSPLQDYVRADAIHVLYPVHNRVTSLPRDLVITDPCTGEASTLSRQYTACGASAEERLIVAVEDLIGAPIDAYVEFDYVNYAALIDELGGVDVCVENPLRGQAGGRIRLFAGCTPVGGNTALWWARHRLVQELVDGEWRPFPGVGDLQRIDHQHEILEQVVEKLAAYRVWNPGLNEVTQHLRLSSMSIIDGLRLARELRQIEPASLRMERVDGEVIITEDGMYGIVAADR